MPELTSLKVPVQVRDRFAAVAKARGVTVRALLDELSRQSADAMSLHQVAEQMAQLRGSDAGAWDDYVAEGQEWDEGTVEPVAT